jgi:hypothetical protein
MAESRTPDALSPSTAFTADGVGERGSGVFFSMDHASTKR